MTSPTPANFPDAAGTVGNRITFRDIHQDDTTHAGHVEQLAAVIGQKEHTHPQGKRPGMNTQRGSLLSKKIARLQLGVFPITGEKQGNETGRFYTSILL